VACETLLICQNQIKFNSEFQNVSTTACMAPVYSLLTQNEPGYTYDFLLFLHWTHVYCF